MRAKVKCCLVVITQHMTAPFALPGTMQALKQLCCGQRHALCCHAAGITLHLNNGVISGYEIRCRRPCGPRGDLVPAVIPPADLQAARFGPDRGYCRRLQIALWE